MKEPFVSIYPSQFPDALADKCGYCASFTSVIAFIGQASAAVLLLGPGYIYPLNSISVLILCRGSDYLSSSDNHVAVGGETVIGVFNVRLGWRYGYIALP